MATPRRLSGTSFIGTLVACALALGGVTGCSQTVVREHSVSLDSEAARATWLGQQAAQRLAEHGEGARDGFSLLANGQEAFAVRAGLIHQAERELDIQTYLLGDGQTTRLILERLLSAAEEGVRVRLLIDDMGAIGQGARLAALATHPNIEVRIYNAMPLGRGHLWTRVLAAFADPVRQHRRMHNKLWIADNSVAIVGGRNLGDEYFDADDTRNFTDLDLVTIGPVVNELSHGFDLYWNHGLAQPVARYHQAEDDAWRSLKASLEAWLEANADAEYFVRLRRQPRIAPPWERLHWGEGTALWDAPGKPGWSHTPEWQETLLGDLRAATDPSERLVVISAYFVPTEWGVERLTALADRGVDIDIITNSLASTDAAVVHGAYAPWRERLLAHGIDLFELRPEQEDDAGQALRVPGRSASALHIKALGLDDDKLFVGSFNADPRSVLWNSEVGVLAESASLVTEFEELVRIGQSPAISYQVRQGAAGLEWHYRHNGEYRVLTEEPGSTWRQLNAWFSHVARLERWL